MQKPENSCHGDFHTPPLHTLTHAATLRCGLPSLYIVTKIPLEPMLVTMDPDQLYATVEVQPILNQHTMHPQWLSHMYMDSTTCLNREKINNLAAF